MEDRPFPSSLKVLFDHAALERRMILVSRTEFRSREVLRPIVPTEAGWGGDLAGVGVR